MSPGNSSLLRFDIGAGITKHGSLYQTKKLRLQHKIVKKDATTNTEKFGEELYE